MHERYAHALIQPARPDLLVISVASDHSGYNQSLQSESVQASQCQQQHVAFYRLFDMQQTRLTCPVLPAQSGWLLPAGSFRPSRRSQLAHSSSTSQLLQLLTGAVCCSLRTPTAASRGVRVRRVEPFKPYSDRSICHESGPTLNKLQQRRMDKALFVCSTCLNTQQLHKGMAWVMPGICVATQQAVGETLKGEVGSGSRLL